MTAIQVGPYIGGASSVPTWVTGQGTIATVNEQAAVSGLSVVATPSAGSISYSIVGGSLPSGLTLNPSSGAITGTTASVNSETSYVFTVRATDDNGSADRSFSITVLNNITLVWVTPAGSLGTTHHSQTVNYTVLATASGAVSYLVTSGSLPPGSSLHPTTGVISGPAVVVVVSTVYTFGITATSAPDSEERIFTITINPNQSPFWVTPSEEFASPYAWQASVNETLIAWDPDNGYLPMTYTIVGGALPSGLVLNSTTGNISGTVTAGTGTYTFTVRADNTSTTSDRSFTIVVT